MAVMSRKKKAIAQGWKATDEQRNKENQPTEKEEQTISDEEHNKRVEMLKSLGIMKD